MTSLKRVGLVQALTISIGTILFYIFERQGTLAYLAGSGLVTFNFILLGLFWYRVLDKKPVAMTLGLVVFKYTILAAVLYFFVMELKLPLLPLTAGLSTVGVSIVVAAMVNYLTRPN